MVAEDYVHRIGRTGRAGSTGDAISLVCVDEWPLLGEIQALLRKPIPTETIAGFEPDRSIRPEPIRQRTQGGGGRPMGNRGGRPNGGAFRPNAGPARQGGGAFRPSPGVVRPVYGSSPRPNRDGRPDAGTRSAGPQAGRPNNGHARPAQNRFDRPAARRGPGPVGIGNAPAPRPGQHPGDRRPSPNGPRAPHRGPQAGGHRALPGERFAGSRPDRS
jgi:ATP-dependent RNA helicase RhlE